MHKFITQNDWLYSKMIEAFLTWFSRIDNAFDCMNKFMTIRTSFLSWWYFVCQYNWWIDSTLFVHWIFDWSFLTRINDFWWISKRYLNNFLKSEMMHVEIKHDVICIVKLKSKKYYLFCLKNEVINAHCFTKIFLSNHRKMNHDTRFKECRRRFLKKWNIDVKIETFNEKCFYLHVYLKSKNFSFTSKCACHEDLEWTIVFRRRNSQFMSKYEYVYNFRHDLNKRKNSKWTRTKVVMIFCQNY